MSAIQYAKRVRCDWPLCTEEAEVVLTDEWPNRQMPRGWVDLGHIIAIRQVGMPGRDLREICPTHSTMTIAFMAGVLSTDEAAVTIEK